MKKLTKDQLKALQEYWYAKVKASGFNDIERGKDLNKFAASSLPSKHLGGEFLNQDANERDGQERGIELIPFQDTDRAERWRILSAQVQSLPTDYPYRAFLEEWVESGTYPEPAKRHGLTIKRARILVQRVIKAAGLKPQGKAPNRDKADH